MTKRQLSKVGAVAAIGGGIVTLHGVTGRRWQKAHTVFAALAATVAVLSFVQGARGTDAPPARSTTPA